MAATTVAAGSGALASLTTGTENVVLGSESGKYITTGGQNVIVGYNGGNTLVSGSGNILIGSGADVLTSSTSDYLNIGGIITGNTSTGAVAVSGAVTGSNLSGTNTGDQTIALTGDVTGSGTGSFAATIASNAVSNAKLAQMAAHTYKGNNTASTANSTDVTSTQLTADLNLFTSSLQGLTPASGGGTTNYLRADGSWAAPSGGGSGTVTSVAASGSQGVTISGSPITASGTLAVGLGSITPTSVAATSTVTGSNLSGTNTGDQTIALTGDVTGSGTGSFAATIASNAVSNAKLAQMAAHTYKGNNTASTANSADVTSTQLTADLNLFTSSLQGLTPASGGGTTNYLRADGSWAAPSGGGSGTVTSVAASGSQGVTISGSPITASGTLAVGLGSITPTSVAATSTVTGSNLSGTNTGDQTIALTGDVTGSGTGSFAATIASNAVSNAKLAQMAAHTYKGNNTASSANPIDVTPTQLTAELNLFTSSLQGLTPASAGGTTNYLRADGTWAAPSGGGGGSSYSNGFVNRFRNPGMDIWTRGTSSTSISTTGAYFADGWIVVPTGASCTAAKTTSNQRTGALTLQSLLLTGANSVTDILVKQRIESSIAGVLQGQNVVFSAQIYNNTGSSITPTLTVKHASTTDTWTSSTTDISAVSLQACANGAWTQIGYIFSASSSSGNGLEITVDFGNNFSTTGKSIQITECDVRVAASGSTTGQTSAVPVCELRPFPTEFDFCKRYFCSSYPLGTAPGASGNQYMQVFPCPAADNGAVTFSYGVQMRTAPTIAYWDAAGNASKSTYFNNSLTATNNNAATVAPTNATTFGFQAVLGSPGTTSNGGIALGWSASAEL